jgi:pyruvate/2-oxoglutarate/acetoin dehydrogenase E1 component
MARKRMIQAINEALFEEMERDKKVILFGEDVEISLFGDTKGLHERFGPAQIRNTPISETVMTGAAVGAAAAGYRVVCHLMYGNFMYTGMDSIANQAAKLRYMTGGQIKLPIVYLAVVGGGRSAGAQHSDVLHPLFMNLGGLKVIAASTPADAKGLLKAAIRDDNPVVFFQTAGRGGDAGDVPEGDFTLPIGVGDIKREGSDVSIIAVGSMVRLAMKAAQALEAQGISAEVVDPRTLVPLDEGLILKSVAKTGRAIVVDEARLTCSAASEIAAIIAEKGFSSLKTGVRRIAVPDVGMPYSPVLEKVCIPTEDDIVRAASEMMAQAQTA